MGDQTRSTLYCSFCGKSKEEVERLINGPTVFICNECIETSLQVLIEENVPLHSAAASVLIKNPTELEQVTVSSFEDLLRDGGIVAHEGPSNGLEVFNAVAAGLRFRLTGITLAGQRAERIQQLQATIEDRERLARVSLESDLAPLREELARLEEPF